MIATSELTFAIALRRRPQPSRERKQKFSNLNPSYPQLKPKSKRFLVKFSAIINHPAFQNATYLIFSGVIISFWGGLWLRSWFNLNIHICQRSNVQIFIRSSKKSQKKFDDIWVHYRVIEAFNPLRIVTVGAYFQGKNLLKKANVLRY